MVQLGRERMSEANKEVLQGSPGRDDEWPIKLSWRAHMYSSLEGQAIGGGYARRLHHAAAEDWSQLLISALHGYSFWVPASIASTVVPALECSEI